jgi:large subunit ribosomal protein L24
MKKFSSHWISSNKPKKQRKYLAQAPNHVKRKLISSNLSKSLRTTHKKRSLPLRKKDTVKVMRGAFKKKTGKVIEINAKYNKVFIENIQKTKKDGTKISIPFDASNLQIIELNTDDKKRINKSNEAAKQENK